MHIVGMKKGDFFGIHSPSRLMAYAGEMLVEGLANAIVDNTDEAVKASEQLADSVVNTFDGMADDISAIEDQAFNDVNISKGITVDEVYNAANMPTISTPSLNDDYTVVGFSKAFESFIASAGGYGASNSNVSNTGVVIRMGDISVSGVLDKDAADQIGAMLKDQADDLKDYFESSDDIYTSVMNKAKKDNHFEKMVQSMTTDRLAGSNTLIKNNISF